MFGVFRPSVREALNILGASGLVEALRFAEERSNLYLKKIREGL